MQKTFRMFAGEDGSLYTREKNPRPRQHDADGKEDAMDACKIYPEGIRVWYPQSASQWHAVINVITLSPARSTRTLAVVTEEGTWPVLVTVATRNNQLVVDDVRPASEQVARSLDVLDEYRDANKKAKKKPKKKGKKRYVGHKPARRNHGRQAACAAH